jgi:hypothetical protein
MDHGLGYLPDIPKPEDYTEDHEQVVPLLRRTGLAPRVGAASLRGGAPTPASVLPSAVDLSV